jgi:hypothetical protein
MRNIGLTLAVSPASGGFMSGLGDEGGSNGIPQHRALALWDFVVHESVSTTEIIPDKTPPFYISVSD